MISGNLAPPSRLVIMSTREFAQRMTRGRRGRRPLFYGETERVYLQETYLLLPSFYPCTSFY